MLIPCLQLTSKIKKVLQKQINKWHKYVSVETFNSTHNKEKNIEKKIKKIIPYSRAVTADICG